MQSAKRLNDAGSGIATVMAARTAKSRRKGVLLVLPQADVGCPPLFLDLNLDSIPESSFAFSSLFLLEICSTKAGGLAPSGNEGGKGRLARHHARVSTQSGTRREPVGEPVHSRFYCGVRACGRTHRSDYV